jgi:hypothetical protein
MRGNSKEQTMKNFLAIYLGTAAALSDWNALPESVKAERQAEGGKAWHEWLERHKSRIVDTGAPLGKTKRVSRSGVEDVRNAMTAFTVVRAETHDDAAKLFEGHPHFTIFPGESIDIMECLPIPPR